MKRSSVDAILKATSEAVSHLQLNPRHMQKSIVGVAFRSPRTSRCQARVSATSKGYKVEAWQAKGSDWVKSGPFTYRSAREAVHTGLHLFHKCRNR